MLKRLKNRIQRIKKFFPGFFKELIKKIFISFDKDKRNTEADSPTKTDESKLNLLRRWQEQDNNTSEERELNRIGLDLKMLTSWFITSKRWSIVIMRTILN